MGTVSSPSNLPRPPVAPSVAAPGGETPSAGPGTASSRYHFADRPVAMGPSGAAIVLTIVGAVVAAWLYLRPPSKVGDQSLQRYTGFEAGIEAVVPRNCAPPGCAGIYLTPTAGKSSKEALPEALALARELGDQGIECFVIIGEEPIAEAVKRARAIRRQLVFDPFGEWAKASGIAQAPYWIAWRTGGNIRLRSTVPPTAADIVAALR